MSRGDTYCNNVHLRLTPGDIQCLRLANQLRQETKTTEPWRIGSRYEYPNDEGMLTKNIYISSAKHCNEGLGEFRGSTWLTRRLDHAAEYVFWASTLAAGSMYGGLHLLACDGPFTSDVERWMWRTSCFIIASPLVLVIMIIGGIYLAALLFDVLRARKWWNYEKVVLRPLDVCYGIAKRCTQSLPDWIRDWLVSWSKTILWSWVLVPAATFALAYVIARIYLIVECFISLAHLPPAVYREPEWSRYIPHFGSG